MSKEKNILFDILRNIGNLRVVMDLTMFIKCNDLQYLFIVYETRDLSDLRNTLTLQLFL